MLTSREIERVGRSAGLNRTEASIFAYVVFWGPKGRWKVGWTYTSRAELSAEFGISERTVDRALVKLREAGLIQHQTDYHERRRTRVTLLRASKTGDELLNAAASKTPDETSSLRASHARTDGRHIVNRSGRTLPDRRAQSRQNGGTHSTSEPSEVFLSVISSGPSRNKESASPKENFTDEGNFINSFNLLLKDKLFPVSTYGPDLRL